MPDVYMCGICDRAVKANYKYVVLGSTGNVPVSEKCSMTKLLPNFGKLELKSGIVSSLGGEGLRLGDYHLESFATHQFLNAEMFFAISGMVKSVLYKIIVCYKRI